MSCIGSIDSGRVLLTRTRTAIHSFRSRWHAQFEPALFILLFAATTAAQEFRYEFHDTPRPGADVVVERHTLRQGPGTDLYLVGRVFNRG